MFWFSFERGKAVKKRENPSDSGLSLLLIRIQRYENQFRSGSIDVRFIRENLSKSDG
jgi:hypothetical protein